MMRRIILYSIFLVSIAGNVAFFLADGITYLRVYQLQKTERTNFPKALNTEDFRQEVFNANMKILMSGNRPDIPNFPTGVIERIKYNIGYDQPSHPFFEGGEPNHVMVATLQDAICRHDTVSIASIREIFDSRILHTELTEVDCSYSGGVAILLYQLTSNEKYKDYADNTLNWLVNRDTENGILYWKNNNKFQLNDGYGMYLPFLNAYSKAFGDTVSRKLIVKQMEIAAKYLMDSVSGIPVHGFTLDENHSKVMMCNFGRGISWFVSGLVDLDTSDLSTVCLEAICRLDSTLCKIWEKEGHFSQFPGQGGPSDLSAELPILYYLSHKGLVQLSDDQLLQYSTMADNGLLYHSSGSVTTTYSNLTGPNILAQAFILRLLNEKLK